MAGKAQRELENLLTLEEHSQRNQAQLEAANAAVTFPGGNEAEFDLPAALKTGVAASWILGPGGILLGLAQGFAGKRQQQNAIDQFLAEQEIVADVDAVFNDEISSLQSLATNDEDLAQLSSLQATKDAAIRMMNSADPEMQQNGAAMLSTFQDQLNAFTTAQETQRIDNEVRAMEAARDLDQFQQGVQQTLLDDYDRQSASFESVVQNSANAKEMIARGNPVDITAALIQVNKALDPTSVVRPEEAQALGNQGTLLEQGLTKLEQWAGSGRAISREQREELMTLVEGIEDTARGFQMKRDIRFQERAVDAGLPNKYVNDFRRVTDLPAFKQGPLQEPTSLDQDIEAGITGGLTDVFESILGDSPAVSLEELAKRNPRVRSALNATSSRVQPSRGSRRTN